MAELRSSRIRFRAGGAAALYEKAPAGGAARPGFGGPPRLPEDYAEIFGGFAAACSIPVLDLPPLPLAGGRSSGIDYTEIFGGCRGGGFALSYEDLVAEPRRPPPEVLSEQRVPKEAGFDRKAFEVSKLPSEGSYEDDVGCSERDQILSNFSHSVYARKQCNTSSDSPSQKIKADTVNVSADLSQPHPSRGSMFMVGACSPSHNTKIEHLPNKVVSDLHLNGDVKVERASTSSCDSAQVFENDLKQVQLQVAAKYPASEIGPASSKNHSRSSSYHSTSSGDISYPDHTFVAISDISLQTQPLKMPPPSRPPPKLDSKQVPPNLTASADSKANLNEGSSHKSTTYHQTHNDGGTYQNHVLQEDAKEHLPYLFDVEVDGSSAAAASAAAMKEAMKQAQARLKSAKELMERKQNSLQTGKLGHHDVDHEKRRANRSAQHVRSFSADMSQKTILKEGQQVNAIFVEKRQESTKQPTIVSDLKEKKTYFASAESVKGTIEGKKPRSSQMLNKIDNGNGKWKADQQFYELLNYEEKFKMVPDFSDQKGFEQKPKSIKTNNDDENMNQVHHDLGTAWQANENECSSGKAKVITEANYDKGNRCEVVKTAHDYERDRKLHAGNDACESDSNATESRVGVIVGKDEEIKEILNEVPEVRAFEENKNKLEEYLEVCAQEDNEHNLELERASNSNEEGETAKKVKGDEEVHGCADEERSDAVAVEKARAREDKNKELTGSNMPSVLEEVHQREEEEKKRVAGKEGVNYGKELNAAFETFETVNVEVTVPHGSCLCSMGEKRKAAQDASQCIENEKTGEPGNHSCNYEVNEYKSVALEPDESKSFDGIQEACESMKYEKKSIQVTQEDLVCEENKKKLKSAQEAVEDTDNRRKLETDKGTCPQELIEKESREVRLERQQNQKKHKIISVPLETEKCENGQKADENKQEHQATNHIKEVNVAKKGMDVSQEVGQRIKTKDLKSANLAASLGEKKNKASQALDAIDRSVTRSAENAVADMQNEDKMEKEQRKERESEQEKELARKLEEEKEREREREKDRLAVETATREACERALGEGRARTERIAVERVTAEGRQRALAEAREKAERGASEALDKSLAERTAKEARLRAERAAVERATAEARERAAEKAASEARKHLEKSTSLSKDGLKKDNEAEGTFRASFQEDGTTRTKATGMRDGSHDAEFQRSYQRHSEGESALRRKARLERHQRTVERAAKALAEKNMRDMLVQREQAERHRLAEFLDADVKRWSSGKEGNLRALLSTLQYILGPDSGWQPIPLTEVITAAAVKKAYRKATLYVHPDKLQQRGASIQQKYICEKVFDLLKDAWNLFNSEER